MQPLSWYYLAVVGAFIPYLCVRGALKKSPARQLRPFSPLRMVPFTALLGGFAIFTARLGGIALFSPPTNLGAIARTDEGNARANTEILTAGEAIR